MSRKVYELAFQIAGAMNSNFERTFSISEQRIKALRDESKKLSSEYKKGLIPLDQYTAKQASLTRQINETKRAQELLNKTNERAHSLASNMARAAVGSVRNAVTIGAGAVAIGGGFILGDSIKKSMDYEAQLASIQALTGINNDELKKMDDLALKMGADTKYSALQAAQGIEELLKAGLSPATVQAGGLAAALNLATAGGLDLTESAEVMSDALNGFKDDKTLKGPADAANILAGAANASSTDVHQLKESLSAVGPVGNMLGVTFSGVNATLAAFSNNSLKGSDAGTSLKTMLMNLQPQTKQATALFQKYGLITAQGTNIFFKANGELKDMADVAGILQDKFKDLNAQKREDVLANLFGTDAVRAAAILYKEGAAGIQEMYKEMSDVTALEVAKKKMDNAAGSIEQLKGAIETLQIRALRPTLPYIKKLADVLGNAVEKYTPAIVNGIQRGVDTASAYLHSHFLDNEQFKSLDFNGKVHFIFNDLTGEFNKWLDNGGSAEIKKVSDKIVAGVVNSIQTALPAILPIATQIGTAIIQGVGKGIADGAKDVPILGNIIKGDNTMNDNFNDFLGGSMFNGGGVDGNGTSYWNWFRANLSAKLGIGAPIQGPPTPHATGGIFNRAHLGLVAEAGPEAIIPLNGSSRAKSLWQTAGEKLGMGGGGTSINFTFAPVVHGGSAAENGAMLEEQRRSFEDQMSSWMRQQRRLSFSG